VVLASVLLLLATAGYFWCSTPLPAPEHLRQRAAQGTTRLLDRNGTLLYEVPNPLSGYQQPVPLTAIPPALQHATIATEDGSFSQNPGVDVRGMLRALWSNVQEGAVVAGGSTITQQLVRNVILDPHLAQQRTLERKLREMVLALKLTRHYTKDDILTLYLNHIYYGGMSYGVEAAAHHYFGRSVGDLDLAECALLAGLPQAPSAYNPLVAPDVAQQRQRQVLDAMVRDGYITPEEAARARSEKLQFAPDAAHHTSTRTMHAPHAVIYVLNQLTAEMGAEAVLHGGLTITTTLDLPLQQAAQESLQRHLALLSTPRNGMPNHQVHNGAVVVLDPADGAVLAMVGSPDFSDAAIQGQVNGAIALRQPGSAIKPLTYAAALEQGWTPATRILDAPTTFQTREGHSYTPQNYDLTHHGELSLREALATSSNVAAVKVLDNIGVPALLAMAERLGISTLQQHSGSYGLALTLGGGEVTLLELSSAYAAFANGGQRITPATIAAVQESLQPPAPRTPPEPVNALDPQIAYLISDILADRYARMHAFGVNSVLDIDRPAAVKTGTTSDWRDNWTIGYTPQRVVGVWVGNADGSPMQAISGISGAGPVWHEVMLAAHRGLPEEPFTPPEGIIEVEICGDDGLLATPDCTTPRLERFVSGTEPLVSGREQQAPHAATSDKHHPTTAQPVLIAPVPGSVFSLAPGMPVEQQRIEVRGRIEGDQTDTLQVTLLVDEEPLATLNAPPYRAWWQLAAGQHTACIEMTDSTGNTTRSDAVPFTVIQPGEEPEP
jgi:1A family penicillin-binding protein